MNSVETSFLVFVCVFGGALVGLFLRLVLPQHHLSEESKDAVKLGAGLIATLTALVLGLLISSAKASFDSVNSTIAQSSAKIILLDRTLAKYGPEAQKTRELLRRSVMSVVLKLWPEDKKRIPDTVAFEKTAGMEGVQDSLRELTPNSDPQRLLHTQALQLSNDILQNRWLLIEQAQVSLPKALFVVLVLWLAILFGCFGILAPKNGTVVVVFLVCALSVAGAMFLIQEMNRPLSGVMKISSAPIVKALQLLGK